MTSNCPGTGNVMRKGTLPRLPRLACFLVENGNKMGWIVKPIIIFRSRVIWRIMQILEAVICLHNLHNSSYYTQHNKRTSDNKHNNKEAITWALVKYFSLVEKPVVGKESVTGFLLKSFVVVVVFFRFISVETSGFCLITNCRKCLLVTCVSWRFWGRVK